ncbi:lysine-specific histone demethylase-like protein, partial [Trifolium medium]|nr:lysine-specific histone demethylase-like protein [Trifolium medium]
MSKELNLVDSAADQFTSSSCCSSSHAASTSALSDDFLIPVSNINAEFQQVGSSGKNEAFQPSAETNLHFIEDTVVKHSTFEAAAAEKDLDMLLDSL